MYMIVVQHFNGLFTPPTRTRQNCLVDGVNKP